MIELDNVTKVYQLDSGPVHALRGVSLSIDASDFVAVVGQSGSGKSTMMNILGCLDKPTSGRYTLGATTWEGCPTTSAPGFEAATSGLCSRATTCCRGCPLSSRSSFRWCTWGSPIAAGGRWRPWPG